LIVSVSVVLLLGLLVLLLVRYRKLRAWQAIACILFGFYAASTPVAPYVRSACAALAHLLSGIAL
jgi:Na+-translocating ferredoxin:NAD+ oxidoreductase RnfD subunit